MWKKLIDPFFSKLLEHTAVYTDAGSGRWITVREAVFDQLDQSETKDVLLLLMCPLFLYQNTL